MQPTTWHQDTWHHLQVDLYTITRARPVLYWKLFFLISCLINFKFYWGFRISTQILLEISILETDNRTCLWTECVSWTFDFIWTICCIVQEIFLTQLIWSLVGHPWHTGQDYSHVWLLYMAYYIGDVHYIFFEWFTIRKEVQYFFSFLSLYYLLHFILYHFNEVSLVTIVECCLLIKSLTF